MKGAICTGLPVCDTFPEGLCALVAVRLAACCMWLSPKTSFASAGNVDDEHEIQEIYSLLTENYVEDDDAWPQVATERFGRNLLPEVAPIETDSHKQNGWIVACGSGQL